MFLSEEHKHWYYYTETVLSKVVQETENQRKTTGTQNVDIQPQRKGSNSVPWRTARPDLAPPTLQSILRRTYLLAVPSSEGHTGCNGLFTHTGLQQRCKLRAEKYSSEWLPDILLIAWDSSCFAYSARENTLMKWPSFINVCSTIFVLSAFDQSF